MSGECGTLCLMAGGFHTRNQLTRNLSLEDRTTGSPVQPPVDAVDPPAAPRACWLTPTHPMPGHIVAWQQLPDHTWQAVVVLTALAAHVQPRD